MRSMSIEAMSYWYSKSELLKDVKRHGGVEEAWSSMIEESIENETCMPLPSFESYNNFYKHITA